ncbi:fructose-6-phosphate aldolase [Clostridium sp. SYSU_GA19001]|uniref:fructose-6-phosphate aldolase n=1 Tax=Clostridium caldaquaticum TaxID=2940653 RepID=UPI0020770C62|nr:fructose-6-phosphate aldolase [Clostridium caldaquaticum]MCM8710054.1 fructose-6-phosphate aldolase [Clostridium caldaquaticum]
MQYILDTADVDFIRKAVDLYPIAGVTTNPTIVAKEKKNFKEIIRGIREAIGEDLMIHVQCLSLKAEDIVKEALYIKELAKGNVFVKIPVIPEGIKAIKLLKERNIKITATAIFTPQQALIAAMAGADYVAPYVDRLDNISADGVKVVAEIVELLKINNLETKVLAASFKNVEQVHKVCLTGVQSVTVNKDLFEKLIYHPLTEWSVNTFISDWENQYGKNKTTLDC